jgi:hypothetical protein
MEDIIQSFLSKYRAYVTAKRTVNCYGDEEPLKKEDGKGESGKDSTKAVPKTPNPKVVSNGAEPRTFTCFNCGEPGPKKIGVLTMGTRARTGMYVAYDVSAPEDVREACVPRVRANGKLKECVGLLSPGAADGGAERSLRMRAHMDTGADLDGVGENLVPYLEVHGSVVKHLATPVEIQWSDKSVTRESRATVTLHFEITGCAVGKDIPFYIVPWETDHLIIGWQTQTQEKWLDRLTDMMAVQRAGGFSPLGLSSEGNETVKDLDEKIVCTDDLFFEPD